MKKGGAKKPAPRSESPAHPRAAPHKAIAHHQAPRPVNKAPHPKQRLPAHAKAAMSRRAGRLQAPRSNKV